MNGRLARLFGGLSSTTQGWGGRAGSQLRLRLDLERYRQVYNHLSKEELQRDSAPLDQGELFGEMFHRRHRERRVLGFYTTEGIVHGFERYGLMELLRNRGFDPVVDIDTTDPVEHRLTIRDPEWGVLVELLAGRERLDIPGAPEAELLSINWLLMQDPSRSFPSGRAPLPNQEHPGLGLFTHFGYLLGLTAKRIGCEGLVNRPSLYHNGHLYGRRSSFVDPLAQGRLRALERDLAYLSLSQASRAVSEGQVVAADGSRFEWSPSPQVLALTPRVRRWFESEEYRGAAREVLETERFRLVV